MNPIINQKLEAMRAHLEARKSMTFGVLPSKAEFMKGWEASMEGEEEYPYHLKGSDALTAHGAGVKTSGKVGADELYAILQKLVKANDDGDDEAGSLASGFLSTLGFEWI
jgi:hypothetical protein